MTKNVVVVGFLTVSLAAAGGLYIQTRRRHRQESGHGPWAQEDQGGQGGGMFRMS